MRDPSPPPGLSAVTAARLATFEAASLAELLGVLGEIYRDDVRSGHIRVVSELVGASVSRPELAAPVVALMEPWVELAESAVETALAESPLRELVSARELALAGVTFYLGANLLTQLLPAAGEIEALLDAGGRLAPALALIEGLGARTTPRIRRWTHPPGTCAS